MLPLGCSPNFLRAALLSTGQPKIFHHLKNAWPPLPLELLQKKHPSHGSRLADRSGPYTIKKYRLHVEAKHVCLHLEKNIHFIW